ncbi:MAG: hypothetical protein ABR530_03275 [Pyrinomonadaceae bacterium]
MKSHMFRRFGLIAAAALGSGLLLGCGVQPGTSNVNVATSNTNAANSLASNANAANSNSTGTSAVETREPEQYRAKVTIRVEAVGQQQAAALPTLTANVARSGTDRRMEFIIPAGGRVVYLDKNGTNYVILPDKKQYAELNRESLGFDVRRMLMPEQIVQQVKNVKGVERVGEEKYNGRDVIKYRYGAVANTQTKAGAVATESFLLVDNETGLPLRSETSSQSQSGGNVQGFSGIRIVTEISDIKTESVPGMFDQPTDFQKIEASQVRSQVEMIFNALAAFASQMMQQAQAPPPPPPTMSPAR